MNTTYYLNNVFHYYVQLTQTAFFHHPPTFRGQSVRWPTQFVQKCLQRNKNLAQFANVFWKAYHLRWTRYAYYSWHLVPFNVGACICRTAETSLSFTYRFSGLLFSNIPRYSLLSCIYLNVRPFWWDVKYGNVEGVWHIKPVNHTHFGDICNCNWQS